MELDDPTQSASTSTSDGTNKQNIERNLATRRHTVGPSETAHNQVMGKHLKFTHSGIRGPHHFYPTTGIGGLGYSPLNLPSHVIYNPLIGLNPMDQNRFGLLPNFDFGRPMQTGMEIPLNAQLPGTPNNHCPNSSGRSIKYAIELL